MNSFDEMFEDVTLSIHGRRKRADPSNYEREKVKRSRHSSGAKVPMVACKHDASKHPCWAEYITGADLALNQEKFYASNTKVDQDAYILRLLDVQAAQRIRVAEDERKRKRDVSTKFHVLTAQGQGKIRVCKATFCSILGISKDRVTRIVKYFSENQEARPENRGGRRNADQDSVKRDAILGHVKQFKCRASHYGRKDSPGRRYLPSDLNISKMYRMFTEQSGLKLSFWLCYTVFCRNFNLGFSHPATDVCSTCTQFRNRVKDPAIEEEQKKVMAAEFILHRRKARQFYNIMNDVQESITVCFDVMENLVLPRTPIGQAYYSRQVYLYVFGIIIHRSNGTQRKDDTHLFTWMETENRKDSNMIVSALRWFLTVIARDELLTKHELRLFSDSCYGQNKNMSMMSMLLALKNQEYPHLNITHTFPVRGHSFLPPDRVFGRLEQEI